MSFPALPAEQARGMLRSMKTFSLLILLFTSGIVTAQAPATSEPEAQTSSSSVSLLPNAPGPKPPAKPTQAYDGIVMGAFCGAGTSYSSPVTKPTVGCGAGMNLLYLPVFFEFGVMAPQAAHSDISGYLSLDAKIPLAHTDRKYLPVLIGGYSRLFETGHALDYGVALAVPRKTDGLPRSLQFELRDYWTFADPHQHNMMLRIGWLVGASD